MKYYFCVFKIVFIKITIKPINWQSLMENKGKVKLDPI